MPELAADGPVPEFSPEAAAKAYTELPPTFGEYAGKVIGETSEMMHGALRRATYDESGWGTLGRALMSAGMVEGGAVPEDYGLTPDLAPVASPHMTKQGATARHPEVAAAAPDLFADNMPQGVVDALADSKTHEIEREAVFQRYEQAHSWVTNFPTRTALTMLDPVNTAALFIPGVGEEAVLARLGTGLGARMTARAVAGATGGVAGMAPGVGLRLGLSEADAGDYGLRQAFSDLAAGAVVGALIHSGIGAAREAGYLKPDALMGQAATHRDATSAAVAQVLDGREVDVGPIFASARSLVEGMQAVTPFTLPAIDEQALRLTSEEAGLRARAAAIEENLGSLAPGDPAAAATLARLEEIDRQVATAATAAERKAPAARRDELLANTTPEKLRAAAAPLEQRRALTAEQASIAGRLDEIAAQRAQLRTAPLANVGQRSVIPYSLSELAEKQRDLHQAGFIPSMPQPELAAASEDLYGAGAKPEALAPVSEAGAVRAAPQAASADQAATLDRQVAEAEQAASQLSLSPEDQTELAAARTEAAQVDLLQQAYATAADCLRIL